MHINTKTFKIGTVDPSTQMPQENQVDPQPDDVESQVKALFEDDTTTPEPEGTVPTNPFDDYIFDDPLATPEDPSLDSLRNFIPDLEDVLAVEGAFQNLDLIETRYKNARADLIAISDNLYSIMDQVSPAELDIIQQKLEMINTDLIIRCDENLNKLAPLQESRNSVYAFELLCLRDANDDGYIGDPHSPNSILVTTDADGRIRYMDPITKTEIKTPIFDPEYSAKITTDDSLSIIEDPSEAWGNPTISSDGDGATEPDEPLADLYLRVNELRESYDNDFNAAIDIGVPQYLWVEANEFTPKMREDEEGFAIPANLWSTDGGLHQIVPENKTGLVQVRVARVEVSSEDIGIKDVDGNKLYHTVVKYFDADDEQILSMRIEGYVGDGPAACTLEDDRSYVAASSLGTAIHGSDLNTSMEVDGSKFKSTGRHIISQDAGDVRRLLGVTMPGDENTRGGMAARETLSLFEGASFQTHFWDTDDTSSSPVMSGVVNHNDADGSFGDADPYGQYHDRYMQELPKENDTLRSFTTGLFITGIRGNIIGSDNNQADFVIIPSVHEYENSEYALNHRLPSVEETKPGDDLYSSTFEGRGGNNLVFQRGNGNLCATGISWAWVEGTRYDEIDISVTKPKTTIDITDVAKDDDDFDIRDPKNFVWIEGVDKGRVLDNSEGRSNGNENWDLSRRDDYYHIDAALIKVYDTDDHDVEDFERLSPENTYDGEEGEALKERATAITDAIKGFDTFDTPIDTSAILEERTGAAAENETEVDGFFSALFGDYSEFDNERIEDEIPPNI